jgi:transcriptional regulator with XRE-family HTH domain
MAERDLSPKRIQERLKALRGKTYPEGITDREFAKKAGISYTQVQRMEGRLDQSQYKRDRSGASPTVERLRRYLSACEVSLAVFFAELEARPEPALSTPASHLKLHERLQTMLDFGEDVERRVADRFDELEGWVKAARTPALKDKKRKAG